MKPLTAICGALLLALPAWAGELKGERKVQPHKLIKLESDIAPRFDKDGKQTTRYSWKVTATSAAGKLIEVDSYRSANVFVATAPAGSTVKVDLTVVDFDARIFDEASAVVEVEGKPEPPPDPVPQPDGELGLIRASRDGKALVSASDREGAAATLAAAQRVHAAKVAAGVFPGPKEILEGWRVANNGVFTTAQAKEWAPWAEAVRAKLEALYKAKKLESDAAWASAFREIGAGLDGKLMGKR